MVVSFSNDQSGGPSWQVEVGRKDSRTASLQGANTNLPAPTSGVATLVQKFRNVGLSAKDMVALSGNQGSSIFEFEYVTDSSHMFMDCVHA